MSFKIATWNVNSIRIRLNQVIDWIKKEKPDVLAVQETKTPDDQFPKTELETTGYHIVYSGEKSYNGVATISKKKPKDIITTLPKFDDTARRILGTTIGDVRILNVYVPNGREVGSEHYDYKLDWLKHLQAYAKKQLKEHKKLIILGDFNIAPEDRDVYDPKAWEGHVLVSPQERKALQKLLSLGLTDTFRLFEHDEKDTYSWWDYRFGAFWRNMGLRLDLILSSRTLANHCKSCEVDKTPRKLKPPSDHAPVVAIFK
jgi:exodeoxyribonuclease-3